ncbi:MAG: Crp/Fnr family transcriptional regulator [Betaproteobacteria bacterium]|nr:Crp/Fnr family transcriptional regulator [Betaproteobacteria bacterium]
MHPLIQINPPKGSEYNRTMPHTGNDKRADGHLDVLGAIPAEYRKAVLEQCERRVLRKGGTIWSQGEPADYVAFVMSGKAMSSYQSRNGKTGTTGFWCPGDILGAGDLGSSMTRMMTLRCMDECIIYTLSHERFNALVRRFPELAQAMIRALSVRLRWVAQLAVILETQSAFERICAILCALAERFGAPSDLGVLVDIRLTHEDLAAIAGVSRQFANTTLRSLQKRGLLVTRKRSLILTDLDALAALAYLR